jgi:putative ABC transport system permease protein
MPVTTFIKTYGMVGRDGYPRSVNITVRAQRPALLAGVMDDTRRVMRAERRLRPDQEDNFDFFSSSSLITEFNRMSQGVKIAAFIIGIIALVVAGIGIMNIMLVAVTERTREIGIRKALGAKPSAILLQFLVEAVVLCNIGGVFGVLAGFGLGNVMTFFSPFAANVPLHWAVIGLLFCTAVGVGFGLLPALRASRMQPIDALRYE